MRATAWSNGSPTHSGAGYALKVSEVDRDRYFSHSWTEVTVDLPDGTSAPIRLSESFWRHCSELRSAAVGRWLMNARLAPWPRGEPPGLTLMPVAGNRFQLTAAGR